MVWESTCKLAEGLFVFKAAAKSVVNEFSSAGIKMPAGRNTAQYREVVLLAGTGT